MKEEIKLNCVKFKRFNGNDDYISVEIRNVDIDDNLHKGNNKLVISIGDDPIVIIPSEFILSFEEVIEVIINQSFLSSCKKENPSIKTLLKGLDLDLRAWSKNKYDTHFLYYKISFPLLKRLKEVGETKFQIIFQQEILKRYATSSLQVKEYLEREGYLQLICDFF
jgi:hypothetical protein